MTNTAITEIFRDVLFTALKLCAPVLIVSVLVGLVISILQAATQVHEQTLTFAPKLVAIGLVLLLLSNWMMEQMNDLTLRIFEAIASSM
ncbi:flagellar biosynthesis protein FliQ [Oscillospiraceae bacterium MB08-C2-2]|nr:flagellar biosynthesis protein FliQ [Oscillospiraceae bacterium MB08-C2-2]